jgi:hypothetical protein
MLEKLSAFTLLTSWSALASCSTPFQHLSAIPISWSTRFQLLRARLSNFLPLQLLVARRPTSCPTLSWYLVLRRPISCPTQFQHLVARCPTSCRTPSNILSHAIPTSCRTRFRYLIARRLTSWNTRRPNILEHASFLGRARSFQSLRVHYLLERAIFFSYTNPILC